MIKKIKSKPSKYLKDYNLGEEINEQDGNIFFGKEIFDMFIKPVKLVGVAWTIQDKDGTQMDYKLKTKNFVEKDEGGLTHRVEFGDDEDDA
jgi:hypothetical protein